MAAVEIPRDQWGRPQIQPVGGGKLVGYTRSSTLGKALDDTSNLEKYSMRLVGLGLAARPDLLALVARTPPDDVKALNGLAEQAKEHAGGSVAAGMGTATHKLLEDFDNGIPTPFMVGNDELMLNRWGKMLSDYKLTIHPDYIETFLVCDELQVAGTTDRLVQVARFGDQLVVGDIKTGKSTSVDYSGVSWAVQLACYANSVKYDWDGIAGTRTPLNINKEVGFVFHLPSDGAEPQLYLIDIAIGWEWAHDAVRVRDIRKAGKRAIEIADPEWFQAPGANQELAKVRAWVEERIAEVKGDPKALQTLIAIWPVGIPTLKQADNHTLDQLSRISEAVDLAKAQAGAQFTVADTNPPKPEAPAKITDVDIVAQPAKVGGLVVLNAPSPKMAVPIKVQDVFPGATVVGKPIVSDIDRNSSAEEGAPVAQPALDALADEIKRLTPKAAALVRKWGTEAAEANMKIGVLQHKTYRRFAITQAMVTWARALDDPSIGLLDDYMCKVALSDVGGESMKETTGSVFATLTINEAEFMDALGRALHADNLPIYAQEGGGFSFSESEQYQTMENQWKWE